MNKDHIEGAVDKTTGDIKEAAGKATGNPKLENEGKVDKATGNVKDAVGDLKDAVRRE